MRVVQPLTLSDPHCYIQGPCMIVSTEGGMNIEDVARDNPDAIVKVPVDIDNGN